jgi:hypothetical protein
MPFFATSISKKLGLQKMASFSQFSISLKLGIELAPRRGERQDLSLTAAYIQRIGFTLCCERQLSTACLTGKHI